MYHELRSKKDKEIEEVVQKERGPLLEELKTEMELLESSEGFGLTKFIDFLLETVKGEILSELLILKMEKDAKALIACFGGL